eukprot:35052-Prymnesium_polylepis.1
MDDYERIGRDMMGPAESAEEEMKAMLSEVLLAVRGMDVHLQGVEAALKVKNDPTGASWREAEHSGAGDALHAGDGRKARHRKRSAAQQRGKHGLRYECPNSDKS